MEKPRSEDSAPKPAVTSPRFQTLRGMRDILPAEAACYSAVEQAFWNVARRHGFQEIRTPVLEATDLFARTIGETSDIVHKEMYTFQDRSENSVTLRPESTASVARAYVEHGMGSLPQPVRLAYVARHYRYERPQAGRWREHEQFGMEVFGSADPAIDAQIILTSWQALEKLGLTPMTVQVNSIGEEASKKAIRKIIVDTLRPMADKLSSEVQRQLKENPLRILDSKDPATREQIAKIPPLIDQLTPEDRDHFTAVLEYLDQVEIAYELNPRLVRGLDYYTRTVFEFWGPLGGQVALCAGGRYDRLVEHLGGQSTPGVGVGVGIDRIVDALRQKQGKDFALPPSQIFVVQLGDVAKQISFGLVDQLTREGMSVTSALGKDNIRAQLRQADKLGVQLALILGQKEAMDRSIIIRDMASGMQETVLIKDVVREVQNRLPSLVTKATAAPKSRKR